MPRAQSRFHAAAMLAASLVVSLTALTVWPAAAQDSQAAVSGQVQRSALLDFRLVTVATGLVNPWSMAFLPNGDMLITERPGRLRIVRNGQLLAEPVAGVPEVRQGGQGGLLDVVLHPDFATNRLVYLSYAKLRASDSLGTTAIVRGRLENDRLVDVEEILEAEVWSRGRGHHGSRLAFDRDGYLFITVGDRQVPPRGTPEELAAHPAQGLSTHHGKVLRVHDDGRVPTDNPFVGRADALPTIWSYGHRNMQGLAVHPETNELWLTEHGPQGGDEVNIIEPGNNYGWPVVGFGVNYRSGTAIHEGTTREGMQQPVHVWVPSIGASGLMIYTGDKFPEWRGNVFAGGLAGERLARLAVDGRRVMDVENLVQRMGRIRDVRQGADGFIYLAFDSRSGEPTSVVRLEPVG